jgi:hypothetical protein
MAMSKRSITTLVLVLLTVGLAVGMMKYWQARNG